MWAVSPLSRVTLVPAGTTLASTSRMRLTDWGVCMGKVGSAGELRLGSGPGGLGQRPDPFHHGEQSVLAGGTEMLVQAQPAEDGPGIGLEDFRRGASAEDQ